MCILYIYIYNSVRHEVFRQAIPPEFCTRDSEGEVSLSLLLVLSLALNIIIIIITISSVIQGEVLLLLLLVLSLALNIIIITITISSVRQAIPPGLQGARRRRLVLNDAREGA